MYIGHFKMAAPTGATRSCETIGCNGEAKLQCPTCIKLSIQGSFFCSQECFKSSWGEHKKLHKQAKAGGNTTNVKSYNPWPGYSFNRQAEAIPRGFPASERAVRGSTNIISLSDEDEQGLRVACKLGREVLDIAAEAVTVGITTDEIDRLVHEACIDRECYPSPLNYFNFPKSCCTSINEVICHGIPDARKLEDGDILNIDITTYHRDFHGDLNETFFVGNVVESKKKLVDVTYESLAAAIKIVQPGVRYRELGNVIQKNAQAHGYSVVRNYCGHGIHRLFHTAPSVPHYAKNKAVGIMKAGHSFTIEPMISEGTWRDVTWPDNWTAVTADGKNSAQFEHTLLVTESGCDILTARGGPDLALLPWYKASM